MPGARVAPRGWQPHGRAQLGPAVAAGCDGTHKLSRRRSPTKVSYSALLVNRPLLHRTTTLQSVECTVAALPDNQVLIATGDERTKYHTWTAKITWLSVHLYICVSSNHRSALYATNVTAAAQPNAPMYLTPLSRHFVGLRPASLAPCTLHLALIVCLPAKLYLSREYCQGVSHSLTSHAHSSEPAHLVCLVSCPSPASFPFTSHACTLLRRRRFRIRLNGRCHRRSGRRCRVQD